MLSFLAENDGSFLGSEIDNTPSLNLATARSPSALLGSKRRLRTFPYDLSVT